MRRSPINCPICPSTHQVMEGSAFSPSESSASYYCKLGTELILKAVVNGSLEMNETLLVRRINQTCNETVLNSFRLRRFDAGELIHQYFPEKAAEGRFFDTLFCCWNELRQLTSLIPMQEVEEVDLSAFATMNDTQLGRVFKDTPCLNVKSLILGRACISKTTQSYGPSWPVKTLQEKPLPPDAYHNQQQLLDQGFLDPESVYIMRCLKYYFRKCRSFQLD